MKIKLLTPLVLLFFLPQMASAQLRTYQIDSEKTVNLPLKTNAVINDSKTKVALFSKDKMMISREVNITILDEEGKERGNLLITYDDFSKITFAKFWVYDEEKNLIAKKSLSDFDDFGLSGYVNFYDDLRAKYYEPLIKKTPYTIDYSYEKKYSDFMNIINWTPQFASDIYVCKASLEVTNHSDLSYQVQIKNLPDSILKHTEQDNYSLWEVENLTPLTIENYGPPSREQLPQIELNLLSFEVGGYAGNFESWKNFGQWSYELNSNRQELPSKTVIFIRDMTDSIPDIKERAKRIYEWMQSETRYISIQLGIGGWQSSPAITVDEKKYGDCKALTNYTKALLAAANIKSYYAIIKAGSNVLPIDTNIVSNDFNHAILCVPFKNDTSWLECTSDYTPFGYLGDFTDNRYALVIRDQNSKLVKTPTYAGSGNLQERKSMVRLNESGGIQVIWNAKYYNLQTEKKWAQIDESVDKQKENLYKKININGFHIDQLKYQVTKNEHPIIEENIEFSVRKLATTTSSKMILPLFYLHQKSKFLNEDSTRNQDLIISEANTELDSIFYQIPENYSVLKIPESVEIFSDFGSYHSGVMQKGNQIIYVRKKIQKQGSFPPEKYHDLVFYKNAVIRADKTSLILEKKQN